MTPWTRSALLPRGVNHKNLLWVRVANQSRARAADSAPASHSRKPCKHRRARSWAGHCGSNHPRTETKGLDAALGKMLTQKSEARLEKMEGTPGYPNRKLSLATASEEQCGL